MSKKASGSDKRKAETIDAATGKPDPTPRRIDLSTLRDVRLELAAVYRKMDSGEIESQEGTRRAYVLRQIADILVSAELERRIIELEEKHEQRMREAARPALPLQH
jgi:acyl-CoA reductase-like NAD-dependent aldehyde dehydrogenase